MEELNLVTSKIIGAAIEVHRELGPGLLESAYLACLAYELQTRQMRVEQQISVPVVYKGIKLNPGYRLDMVVENLVVAELKSVKSLDPILIARTLTYLKLSGYHLALILNFNVRWLKDGIQRVIL